MIRKFILPALLCLALSAIFSACDEISYAPSAYGEHNRCYYAYDPMEVRYLQDAGLCPRTWAAYPMPVYWHATYYMYYDSPSYYDHYIPVSRRTYYRTTVIRKFETEHRTEIKRYESRGKWQGSDGKGYDGKTVTTQVKSGKSGFSSGSARQPATKTQSKTTATQSTTKSRITTQSRTVSQSRPSTTSGFRSGSARR